MGDGTDWKTQRVQRRIRPVGPEDRGLQDEKTVMLLRFGIGAIGVVMPFFLPVGNIVFAEARGQDTAGYWPGSMSASYYTSTRNVFVGGLCALGVFLICYRFDSRDDRWSTAAGISAIGVALCPTAPVHPTTYQRALQFVHFGFAGLLLGTLAMFCISSFRDPTSGRQKTWVKQAYLVAGVSIFVFIGLAVITAAAKVGDSWLLTPLYLFESLSVLAFGVAWIGAAIELHDDVGQQLRNMRLGLAPDAPDVSDASATPDTPGTPSTPDLPADGQPSH